MNTVVHKPIMLSIFCCTIFTVDFDLNIVLAPCVLQNCTKLYDPNTNYRTGHYQPFSGSSFRLFLFAGILYLATKPKATEID